MNKNEPATGIYDELLAGTPPELHDMLRRAADGVAARAWLGKGTAPDGGTPAGEHARRRFLNRTGTAEDGARWVEWEHERYDQTDEDLAELEEATDITASTAVTDLTEDEQTPHRTAFFQTLALPGAGWETGIEITPAGTLYVLTETPPGNGPSIYRGLYRLEKDLPVWKKVRAGRDERVWLNGTAERVLARALR